MNVDELSITIKVNNESAVSGIDAVIKKVTELKDVVGSGQGNFAALKDLASAMSQLGSAGKKISSLDFTPLVDGIKQINKANIPAFVSRASEIAPALEELGIAAGYFGQRAKNAGTGVTSIVNAFKSFNDFDPDTIKNVEPFFAGLSRLLSMLPKGVGKDLEALSGALLTLPAAMRNFIPPSEGGWERFTGFLQQMAPLLAQFKKDSDGGATALHHLASAIKSLVDSSSNPQLGQNFQKIAEAIREFMQTVNAVTSDVDLERFSQIAQSLYQVTEAYNHLKTAEQRASSAMSGVSKWTKRINMFGANLKTVGTQVVAFGKKVALFLTTPFRKFGATLLSIGKAVSGFFQRFARLAMMRLMRMAIMKIIQSLQEGIKNLYAWSAAVGHNFAKAMDTVSTAGLYFKNSIAAMFSPLIEAIAPILDAIVDKVVAFINVINQLFALLTGKTVYTAAVKGAKAYEDAAGGAAAAQKELNRTVLAFDELNRLNGPDGNGGGGGGGAGGTEGVFEVRDISSLAERLFSDTDWTWLGTLVTEKLTEQMQALDWQKIQTSANNLATRFGTFLNGAFGNKEFWQTLGTTLGEGINTATGFLNTFFNTTDWTELGGSIAEFIRNAVSTIDWEALGQTITNVSRTIAQIIHGFVKEWTVEDWELLGNSVAEMINGAFFNIDWSQAIPDLVNFATGLLHAINTAIEGIDWHEMFEEIKNGIKNADWASFWSELWELIKNTAPVWRLVLGITIAGAFVKTAASVIRTAIVTALAEKIAAGFGGAAGGAAGGGGVLAGLGAKLSGAAAAIGVGGAITVAAITAAIVVTVVMSVKRAQELTRIQDMADRDAERYRSAFNDALSQGLIDEETYNRGMGMADELDELWTREQGRNPWDTFGLQYEQEADAITTGLNTILDEAGYSIWNFNDGALKEVKKLTGKTLEKVQELRKDGSAEIEGMSTDVAEHMRTMDSRAGAHLRSLHDKSNDYLSSMKVDGIGYVHDLGKSVEDKLSSAKTNGSSYIETLRKNVTDKLSKANTDGTSYTETLRKNVVDKLSDAKTKGSKSIGDLTTDIGSKLSKASTDVASYGGNVGQKFAEGISGKVNTVKSAVAGLASKAASLDIKNSAYAWGSDLGQKYADGINAKGWAVEQAAKNTANKVSKYLHFSEPDVGPLSNFHTFAPDMMRMYAQGIEENKQLVLDQLQSVTGDMSGVFNGVGVNYSQTVETNYDGLIAALAEREEPINVYIGNSKLDTVLARSSKRTDLRTGGR